MALDLSKFTVQKAKPAPVMLLLDVSGSMSGVKIDTLNEAVKSMLDTFTDATTSETDFVVSIITFGEELKRLFPFTPATNVKFENLSASGCTPLGEALKMAKAIIEDRDETPSRAYRPMVVLVSDGQPTDEWQQPLQTFISDGRSAKCDRMAMAIGSDADRSVLGSFVEGTGNPLFEAHRASEIRNFFKRVTMTVTTRTMQPTIKTTVKEDVPPTVRDSAANDSHSATSEPRRTTVNVTLDGPTMKVGEEESPNEDEEFF